MTGEVADQRMDLDTAIASGQGVRRLDQGPFAHVDRHEPAQLARSPERVEQGTGLVARAGTQLDDESAPVIATMSLARAWRIERSASVG